MTDPVALAAQFEDNRARLRAVAYRMLGSATEAEDAVQEAWLRLSRSDAAEIGSLSGWLTTVVSRVCLDMLRSRASRREEPLDVTAPPGTLAEEGASPEQQALLADAVGPALLLVLDTLAPDERLAFVLHDMFAVPFEEIAAMLDRSPAAARQLASRGRRRVRGAAEGTEEDGATPAGDARQREVVTAFLAAARDGNFEALLAVLHPDAVVRTDEAALRIGTYPGVRGAKEVAGMFAGGAKALRPAMVGGRAGLAWALRGEVKVAFQFTLTDGAITEIALIADPDLLGRPGWVELTRAGSRRD